VAVVVTGAVIAEAGVTAMEAVTAGPGAVVAAAEAAVVAAAVDDDKSYSKLPYSTGMSETLISLRQTYLPSFFTNRLM
jgi:hypothetical protein